RDLQNLTAFEVTTARAQLALDLERFTAAAMMAELMLRFAGDEPHHELFDALVRALDRIGNAPADESVDAALAGAWDLIAHLGFAPTVDVCASCHIDVAPNAIAAFSHRVGGTLCPRCARLTSSCRTL